jgi:hypothetical protein
VTFGGATVLQKGKIKMQVLDFQTLAFCLIPRAEAPLLLNIEA